MHWDLEHSFSIIVFELGTQQENVDNSRKDHLNWSRIIQNINQLIENHKEQIILGEWGTKLVLLHSILEGICSLGTKDTDNYLTKTIAEVSRIIGQYTQQCYIGVGGFCQGISNLQQSYQEAKEAVKVAKLTNSCDKAFYYDELGIYRLLHKISSEELHKFVNDTLLPLIEYDQQHKTELVKTLDAYFANNGNLRALAKDLFVHYNTVLYRMERIQSILDVDLNNRDIRLNIEVALKIYSS
ncbi:MAG: helix-turn-helix domain-containing protein [Halanaerobiales bacterium]|nr:helix-turn-helix domain-containing protein [Halanaerobiales bacterium]